MALGSNFWGNLADVHGRKLIAIASLATIAAAGVLTAAARSFLLLLLARGLVGLGIGGNSTCLSYYSEFLPTTVRGHSLSIFHLFWAVGAIAEAGLAWIFVPTYGWRWLALLTSVPASTTPDYIIITQSSIFSLDLANRGHNAGVSEISGRGRQTRQGDQSTEENFQNQQQDSPQSRYCSTLKQPCQRSALLCNLSH